MPILGLVHSLCDSAGDYRFANWPSISSGNQAAKSTTWAPGRGRRCWRWWRHLRRPPGRYAQQPSSLRSHGGETSEISSCRLSRSLSPPPGNPSGDRRAAAWGRRDRLRVHRQGGEGAPLEVRAESRGSPSLRGILSNHPASSFCGSAGPSTALRR